MRLRWQLLQLMNISYPLIKRMDKMILSKKTQLLLWKNKIRELHHQPWFLCLIYKLTMLTLKKKKLMSLLNSRTKLNLSVLKNQKRILNLSLSSQLVKKTMKNQRQYQKMMFLSKIKRRKPSQQTKQLKWLKTSKCN